MRALQRGPPDRPMGMMTLYLLLAALLVGLVIVIMFLIFFPKLEKVTPMENLRSAVERQKAETEVEEENARKRSIDIALRLLEPDERQVIDALMNAGGMMLQKDISWELGFSRVKTHRVLVKLLRRGVVSAEKYYNTNRIKLVDWLKIDN